MDGDTQIVSDTSIPCLILQSKKINFIRSRRQDEVLKE
jgi:hypothetical protein